MKNTFVMMSDTSFALNLLIYIQNIFLNQERGESRFPYVPTKMAFNKDFETAYKQLWEELFDRIAADDRNGAIPFYGEKDLFYRRLFLTDEDSLKQFNEVYQTFDVWWNSFTGYFTLGRSVDDKEQNLYRDFADLLVRKGITPRRPLKISLIYDTCVLADTQYASYFAVLPVRDFFFHEKELGSKLEVCMD